MTDAIKIERRILDAAARSDVPLDVRRELHRIADEVRELGLLPRSNVPRPGRSGWPIIATKGGPLVRHGGNHG